MTDEDTTIDQEEGADQEQALDQEETAADEGPAADEEPTAGEEPAAEEELSEEDQFMAKLKEAVEVEKQEIGALRLKLTVTVPRDMLDERLGEQFAELKRDADVPGFRKGHAPLALVEKRFASDVGDQLLSQLLTNGYLAAVEKEELKPLGAPSFWVKVKEERVGEDDKPRTVEVERLLGIEEALDHLKLPKEGSLTFSCEIELKPDFELPELTGIPVERLRITIEDDDVEAELTRMRMMRGRFEPVDQGEVEEDDLLYADMNMSVEGEVIETEENFEVAARDLTVRGIHLEGFGEAVVGKRIGDEISTEATIPNDHANIDIREKTARFTFKINEIKRLEVPPFDDELLSTMGFDTEDELRDTVRSVLESRLDQTINQGMREQIGRYLVDNTEMEVPEGLSQRQVDRSIHRRKIEMLQAGVPEAEIDKSIDQLRSSAKDQVIRDLKLFFIMERIAEEREITVSEEQINSAIAQIAQRSNKRFDRVRDELSKGDGLMTLYLQLRDGQILDTLLADAQITDTKRPKKKAKKKGSRKKT